MGPSIKATAEPASFHISQYLCRIFWKPIPPGSRATALSGHICGAERYPTFHIRIAVWGGSQHDTWLHLHTHTECWADSTQSEFMCEDVVHAVEDTALCYLDLGAVRC